MNSPENLNSAISLKKISDICIIHLGGTPKTSIPEFWGGNVMWATAKDVSNCQGRFIEKTERNITKKSIIQSNAKIYPKGTIIITARGTVGKIAILGKPMAFNQTCYGLEVKPPNCHMYIFYTLRNLLSEINAHSYGTVFQTITIRTFDELLINIPPVNQEKAIAKILSDLDSKIELNEKMNKTLEAIAQAIFKHWFIDFEFPDEEGKPYKSSGGEMVDSELGKVPEGWKVKYFKDIVHLNMGVSPKGTSYNTDGIGVPLLNGAADFSSGIIEPKKFTTNPVRMCKKGDLLFCIRATIGNLTYSDKAYCIGRGVAALDPVSEVYKEYSYFTLEYGLNNLILKASGSVIKGLSKDDLLLFKIVPPTDKIISKFHLLVATIFSRIQYLTVENHSLSNIRDSLLPKLMTGKIRVPMEDEHE